MGKELQVAALESGTAIDHIPSHCFSCAQGETQYHKKLRGSGEKKSYTARCCDGYCEMQQS